MTMCTDWDYIQVRDFEYLNDLWKQSFAGVAEIDVEKESAEYGVNLINKLELPIAELPLGPQQSHFFKTVYQNPSRSVTQQFIDKE